MAPTQATRRGLTDPERAAAIIADIPEPIDTQRRMNYFVTPRGKRLSEYEILSLYTQPNPDWIAGGLDWGDWTQKFHGGRPSWGNESTELRTTDWYRHRDPLSPLACPLCKGQVRRVALHRALHRGLFRRRRRPLDRRRSGATKCSTNTGARSCSTNMACSTPTRR